MSTLKNSLTAILATLIFATPAQADDTGAKLYATCAACHGAQGEGNAALGAPPLAGQQAAYLERQLQYFRAGKRGNKPEDTAGSQMRAMAAVLPDDAAVTAVSTYLSSLPLPVAAAMTLPEGANLAHGEAQYKAKCNACHGLKAEGNLALGAPKLTGLSSDYLLVQLKHFKADIRNAGDRYNKQMAMMARTILNEEQMRDIVAFIVTQSNESK